MLRFIPGLILLPLVALVMLWINLEPRPAIGVDLLLKVGVPVAFLALVMALWFDSIGQRRATNKIAKLQNRHAKEREKLRVETEKEKQQVRKQAQRELQRHARKISGKANLKVGMAFVVAASAGLLMLVSELVTFGLVTIMTAGGALGGYITRWRQERASLPMSATDALEGEPPVPVPDPMPEPAAKSARPRVPRIINQKSES